MFAWVPVLAGVSGWAGPGKGEQSCFPPLVVDGDQGCGCQLLSAESPSFCWQAVADMNGKEINGRVVYVGRAQKRLERQSELRRKFEQIKQQRVSKYQVRGEQGPPSGRSTLGTHPGHPGTSQLVESTGFSEADQCAGSFCTGRPAQRSSHCLVMPWEAVSGERREI